MSEITPVHQIVSTFTRVSSVSPTEYESRTVNYVDKGGRITTEIIVDVYNRYGAINSVRVGQNNTIDAFA